MNISEFVIRLEKHIQETAKDREKFVISLAGDAIALVTKRVTTKGTKSDGNQFKVPYSQRSSKHLPPIFLKYAVKNKIVPSYENYRKYLGLPTDFKNLNLTGKMWGSIDKKITINEPEKIQATIKSSNDRQKIVNINSAREKTNILSMSDKEKEFIRTRVEKYVNEKINNI